MAVHGSMKKYIVGLALACTLAGCGSTPAPDKVTEALNNTKWTIEYFSKDTKEGYLRKNFQDKFYIEFSNGEDSYAFGCGNSIEVYLAEDPEKDIDEGWYSGRVEYRDKYYFYGPGKPSLYTNMKARIRV